MRNVPSEHGSQRAEQPVGYIHTFAPPSTRSISMRSPSSPRPASCTTPGVLSSDCGGATGRGPSRAVVMPTAVLLISGPLPQSSCSVAGPDCPGGRELAGSAEVAGDPVRGLCRCDPHEIPEPLTEHLEIVRRVQFGVPHDAKL